MIIRIGAGSLKQFRQFLMRLPVPAYRAVIGLSLKKAVSRGGQDYSEVIPVLKAILSVEDGENIKETYTDKIRASYEQGLYVSTEE